VAGMHPPVEIRRDDGRGSVGAAMAPWVVPLEEVTQG
jgi:hypothetical protein